MFLIFFAALLFLGLAWRQHHFVDAHAVNVLFWDQWDFYLPLFNDEGAWALFTRQHGPHRQGLGALITAQLARLGDWNTRWDAFAVSFTLIASALLAIRLGVQCGWRAGLVAIPAALLFLNLRQYEIFVGAANLSHGALPVLLLLGACLAWFIPHPWPRALLLGTLAFLLIFTGFGLFAGLVIPALLALEAEQSRRAADRTRLAAALAGLALIALGWTLFAQGYVFAPAIDDFRFPHPRPWEYASFSGLMLAYTVGIPGRGTPAIILGLVFLALALAVTAWHGLRLLRRGVAPQPAHAALFTLTAFGLLFALNTAVGRIGFGHAGALSSRYIPLLLPLWFALLLTLRWLPRPLLAPAATLATFALAAGMLIPHRADRQSIRWYHQGQAAWRAAYLETRDETAANERTGFKVYPAPDAIAERLAYLEARELNLFRPEPGDAAASNTH